MTDLIAYGFARAESKKMIWSEDSVFGMIALLTLLCAVYIGATFFVLVERIER